MTTCAPRLAVHEQCDCQGAASALAAHSHTRQEMYGYFILWIHEWGLFIPSGSITVEDTVLLYFKMFYCASNLTHIISNGKY